MSVLTISRTRNQVILTRDTQKAAGRLLESDKCFNYSFTFLLQVRLQANGILSQCLGSSSIKTKVIQNFPFECSDRQDMASCLLAACHIT